MNNSNPLLCLRFSMEYLLREGLLDSDGYTLAFTGIISHLYYTEPSNFIFLSFLQSGMPTFGVLVLNRRSAAFMDDRQLCVM